MCDNKKNGGKIIRNPNEGSRVNRPRPTYDTRYDSDDVTIMRKITSSTPTKPPKR